MMFAGSPSPRPAARFGFASPSSPRPSLRSGAARLTNLRFENESCGPASGRGGRSRPLVVLVLLLALLVPAVAVAQAGDTATPPQFNDSAEAQRFHALTGELRCVKCQNQSLADSNAQIAQDLRQEVFDLMRQGKTDSEIKHYLVARYGEFVLYRPRVEPATWLLWFGPAVLLLAGGFIVAGIVRKRGNRQPAVRTASDEDQEW